MSHLPQLVCSRLLWTSEAHQLTFKWLSQLAEAAETEYPGGGQLVGLLIGLENRREATLARSARRVTSDSR